EGPPDGGRDPPRDGRPHGRDAPERAARAPGDRVGQERVRARPLRLVHRRGGRGARVRLPRPGRPGRRGRDRHGGGDRRTGRRAHRPAGGLPRGRRGAVRVLHAGDAPRRPRPARARARAVPRAGPRGARGQPLPLHGLPEDRRRGAPGGRARRGGRGAM
ncbi:MAG: Xanthine dehydrogenase iron-sulfur subunit, partial [uncultured Solirubrobacteraceae bacterium]